MFDSRVSREGWSARYEQLRAGWFAQEVSWGQALFIRGGMAAWMKAWSSAEPPTSATRPGSIAPESDSPEPIAIDGDLQHQLARELANLILHRQQELVA